MKQTDLDRRDREVRRARKKEDVLRRKTLKTSKTVGDYILEFTDLFFFDEEKIYNINISEDILDLLEEMKEEISTDKWDTVLRKAVKKTGVKSKEEALRELKELGDIP